MKRGSPWLGRLGAYAFTMSVAASSAACVTYDRVGPLFTPSAAPDEGYGVVYVYRPKSSWGAAHRLIITQGDRSFTLYAGAYGALVVPEGPSTFLGNARPVEVQGNHAKPVYVRAEFDSLVDSWDLSKGTLWKTEVVSEAAALADLAELGLAPGGRGRYLDVAAPPARAAAPTPPVAPPPAEDPTVDTVYLRDGTAVTGEIVAEDGRAVSVMMKDGHGKAIPRGTIDRIVRRARK